jgi:hypothetical protein
MIKNGAGKVPGLLAVLAAVPDPRRPRGRRYLLVFVLAVAAACTLAGAKTFREIGDQAADLPQNVLRDLGGRLHPLRRTIIAPSETRIRTLLHLIDTEILDDILGCWLRDLADAGKLDGLLTAIAIDGKWLRGVLDGQVKLFSAMLHEEKAVIAQHRIPDETTETTQVRELLAHVDLAGAVVTADAVNAQRDTADYIAGPAEDGGRASAYFLFAKGNQPRLQRAVFGAVREDCPRDPDYTELDEGHGRIIRRSLRVADAENIDFPHVRQVPSPALTRTRQPRRTWRNWLAGSGASNRSTGCVIPHTAKTRIPDMPETAPRPWPRCGISPSACSISPASPRSPAPSRPSRVTETESSITCRYETQVSNDFGDPVGGLPTALRSSSRSVPSSSTATSTTT